MSFRALSVDADSNHRKKKTFLLTFPDSAYQLKTVKCGENIATASAPKKKKTREILTGVAFLLSS